MERYTDQQREILKQFKERIQDIVKRDEPDNFLIKWLVARRFDVTKAEDMYRKSMKWRVEQKIDNILETYEPPEVLHLYYPGGPCGHDKEGRPIVIDPIAKIDLRGILNAVTRADLMRYTIWRMEKIYNYFRQMAAQGRAVDQCVQILDFDGFGRNLLWKPALDLFTEVVQILDLNYPDTLKRTFIINTPAIFPIGFNVMKPFLSEDTVKKFIVLGKNWQTKVYQEIKRDQMPVHWGGTMTDDDGNPTCRSKIGEIGFTVPASYYRNISNLVPEGKLKSASIPRKGEATYPCVVKEPHSCIKYMFASDDKIEFGVRFEKDRKETMVQKMETVQSHLVPEEGFLPCDREGVYTLVFQNPAILSKRKLEYHVELLDPTDTVSLVNTK